MLDSTVPRPRWPRNSQGHGPSGPCQASTVVPRPRIDIGMSTRPLGHAKGMPRSQLERPRRILHGRVGMCSIPPCHGLVGLGILKATARLGHAKHLGGHFERPHRLLHGRIGMCSIPPCHGLVGLGILKATARLGHAKRCFQAFGRPPKIL